MNRARDGARAEQLARKYLERRGCATLASNYRCRWGEIDLVMRDRDMLVFVEVRLRRHRGFGGAIESVDRPKQRKLIRTALHYLQHNECADVPARFDVVTLESLTDDNSIEWLPDAFDAG